MPEIRFDSVAVSYGDSLILEPFTLTLSEHRIGLIGPNGSGKSTLLRLINGLTEPTTGRVYVDSHAVADHVKEVRRLVGFIFSNADDQIIMPTVAEDIGFSLSRLKLSPQQRAERVDSLLNRVGLSGMGDRAPHSLSGGEKQLLALAAVLATEPTIIVADEPTTLLDLNNRRRLAREFGTVDQQLIVATHDLDLLRDFDRVIYINDHRIAADGSPDQVIATYLTDVETTGHE